MSEQKQFVRFSIAQRIEHWAQMLSFFTLGLTGLPQKFAGDGLGRNDDWHDGGD